MRKITVLFLALFLIMVTAVRAQEETLPDPGITPDSPLYFLDTLGESFELFFAFGNAILEIIWKKSYNHFTWSSSLN